MTPLKGGQCPRFSMSTAFPGMPWTASSQHRQLWMPHFSSLPSRLQQTIIYSVSRSVVVPSQLNETSTQLLFFSLAIRNTKVFTNSWMSVVWIGLLFQDILLLWLSVWMDLIGTSSAQLANMQVKYGLAVFKHGSLQSLLNLLFPGNEVLVPVKINKYIAGQRCSSVAEHVPMCSKPEVQAASLQNLNWIKKNRECSSVGKSSRHL